MRNLKNYSPPALVYTTYFRLAKTSANSCKTLTTNIVIITVNPEFTAGSISGSQFVCYNSVPETLTGTAPTGGKFPYSYQWQKTENNNAYTNISGATSLNFTSPSLTSNTWYRQIQSSAEGCGTHTTNVVTVTVFPQFSAGTISSDQSISYNSVPAVLTRTAPTGGSPPYSLQWQRSSDHEVFLNIPGATLSTYQPGALTVTT